MRPIDEFIGELLPGTVTMFDSTHPYIQEILGMLCVQSVGQLYADVLYIDGGNGFDPYGLMVHARRLGVDKDPVLDNIKVARAFTAHQMTNLLYDRLDLELEMHAKEDPERQMTVMVASLLDLYLDVDVNRTEARGMLDRCTKRLVDVTQKRSVITIVTNYGLSKLGPGSMKDLLYNRFHKVVRIERTLRDRALREPRRWHPFQGRPKKGQDRMYLSIPSEDKAMAFYPAPKHQRTLDDFWDMGTIGIPRQGGI